MEIGGGGCLTHFPGKPGSCKRHMKLQVSSSLLCCLRIIKEKRESEKQRMTETTRGCGERDRHTLWFSALQCCETPHQNPPALWITQLRGKKSCLRKYSGCSLTAKRRTAAVQLNQCLNSQQTYTSHLKGFERNPTDQTKSSRLRWTAKESPLKFFSRNAGNKGFCS